MPDPRQSSVFSRRRALQTMMAGAIPCILEGAWAQRSKGLPFDDFNQALLSQTKKIPPGGGYDSSRETTRLMARATVVGAQGLVLNPSKARPSYCSGATYLAFLYLLQALGLTENLKLSRALRIADIPDGTGIWGRWNANGPGVARLFYQCAIGRNFEDWEEAQPGDLMKIFWTPEIGAKERGHLVILKDKGRGKDPMVHFWSSNQPDGFGDRIVARSEIKWAIFSRIEKPSGINRALELPPRDDFLARMLSESFTRKDLRRHCGINKL